MDWKIMLIIGLVGIVIYLGYKIYRLRNNINSLPDFNESNDDIIVESKMEDINLNEHGINEIEEERECVSVENSENINELNQSESYPIYSNDNTEDNISVDVTENIKDRINDNDLDDDNEINRMILESMNNVISYETNNVDGLIEKKYCLENIGAVCISYENKSESYDVDNDNIEENIEEDNMYDNVDNGETIEDDGDDNNIESDINDESEIDNVIENRKIDIGNNIEIEFVKDNDDSEDITKDKLEMLSKKELMKKAKERNILLYKKLDGGRPKNKNKDELILDILENKNV